MAKQVKKQNPAIRSGLVQSRVNVNEMQEIVTKAHMYSNGNLSNYVRLACLNFRPIKKVKVGK